MSCSRSQTAITNPLIARKLLATCPREGGGQVKKCDRQKYKEINNSGTSKRMDALLMWIADKYANCVKKANSKLRTWDLK